MYVAYQGEPGAYSERAVRSLFPDAERHGVRKRAASCVSRVTSREADFGVVPLENSQAGSVNETYDLLPAHQPAAHRGGGRRPRRSRPARRAGCAPRGHHGGRSSHWQALAQCEEFLASRSDRPVPVHDTAGAARMIAEGGPNRGRHRERGGRRRRWGWRSWRSGSRPRRRTSRSSRVGVGGRSGSRAAGQDLARDGGARPARLAAVVAAAVRRARASTFTSWNRRPRRASPSSTCSTWT